MEERNELSRLYEQMYRAMIAKDIDTLGKLHADDFVLTHMTGMKQPKHAYLEAIANGTLNYYSAVTEHLDMAIEGDKAMMTGRSRVLAAVFGGGKHTWSLQLRFTLRKENGHWLFVSARASTY